MSTRGYGVFGLRSGLRIKNDFAEDTAAERNILAEIRPGLVVADWVLHSGSAYKVTVRWPFYRYGEDQSSTEQVRNVVGVSITPNLSTGQLSDMLLPVESIALVISTAGTYFYDSSSNPEQLYIRLPDSSNPNLSTVFVKFGFFFACRAAVHPQVGQQRLPNGGFESLDGWATVVSGGSPTSSLDTEVFIEGTSSLKCDCSGGGGVLRERTVTATYRQAYRLSGFYRTDTNPGETGHVSAEMFIGFVQGLDAHWITEDGRGEISSALLLRPTEGEWRRFVFDFIYNGITPGETTNLRVRIGGNGNVNAGIVRFDHVLLRAIERFNVYEPRLAASLLPDYDVGVNDTLFGGHRMGIGPLRLINADGALENDLGGLTWENADVVISGTGTFEDGQETTFDDRRVLMNGRIQSVSTSDDEVTLALEDLGPSDETVIPSQNVLASAFPLADPDAVGKPRPLLWGRKTRIIPVKIDATARVYEICNVAEAAWSPGIKAVDAVYKYATEEAADNDDPAGRTLLVLTTDYTVDLTLGRITIVDAADDTFIRVDAQGFKDDSAGTYTGTADALISKAPDIAHFIHNRILRRSDDLVALSAFATGRTTTPQPLGIYLRDAVTVREVFNQIEQSVLATITMQGDGALFYVATGESDPATVADMTDGDFLTWSIEKRLRDVYSSVTIRYDQKGNGEWLTQSSASTKTSVVYHKTDTKTVETYLIQASDAIAVAIRMMEIASVAPRRIVANVHGKMLAFRLGQAVTVTRSRAHGPALTATKFRISQMYHSFATNITRVELLEANPGQPVSAGVPVLLQFVNEGQLRGGARRRRMRAGWQELAYYPA